jgi:hypothetical protein
MRVLPRDCLSDSSPASLLIHSFVPNGVLTFLVLCLATDQVRLLPPLKHLYTFLPRGVWVENTQEETLVDYGRYDCCCRGNRSLAHVPSICGVPRRRRRARSAGRSFSEVGSELGEQVLRTLLTDLLDLVVRRLVNLLLPDSAWLALSIAPLARC